MFCFSMNHGIQNSQRTLSVLFVSSDFPTSQLVNSSIGDESHHVDDCDVQRGKTRSFFVVPLDVGVPLGQNSVHQVGGGDAFSSLSCQEPPSLLDFPVGVICSGSRIGLIIVANVVDVVLIEKCDVGDPWSWENDFVDPFAVFDVFHSFQVRVDGHSFVHVCVLVTANPDDHFHVLEPLLHLLEDTSMPEVEQIENPI